jgi:hypothetical protein
METIMQVAVVVAEILQIKGRKEILARGLTVEAHRVFPVVVIVV